MNGPIATGIVWGLIGCLDLLLGKDVIAAAFIVSSAMFFIAGYFYEKI